MSKLRGAALGIAMMVLATAGRTAVPLGPFPAACQAGADRPALLVRILGFKTRTGTVRVQVYGGDPSHYFDKGTYLRRVDVPVPQAGPVEVCLPAERPGTYAVSVRHDLDGSGKTSMSDGGGMSGNPEVSLLDIMFRRKPSPQSVAVRVGAGVVTVPVVLNYVQGASFRPVGSAG